MTRKELRRAVRFVYRYRLLQEEVNAMETRLFTYLTTSGINRMIVSGYKVGIVNDELIITEAPKVDERQLELLKDYFCLELEKAR